MKDEILTTFIGQEETPEAPETPEVPEEGDKEEGDKEEGE